jgi:hypothetical protein
MIENREIADEIALRVFAELGNPASLEITLERLAAMLAIAFHNYREYLLAIHPSGSGSDG